MKTKSCFKCGKRKKLSEFYAHKEMKDKHLNKCKECAKGDAKKYYRKNRDAIRLSSKKRNQSSEARKRSTEACRKRRAAEPIAYKARTAVGNALRDGRLRKEACHLCRSNDRVQAHHPDYTKPLEVVWLCLRCYKIHHGKWVEKLCTTS